MYVTYEYVYLDLNQIDNLQTAPGAALKLSLI